MRAVAQSPPDLERRRTAERECAPECAAAHHLRGHLDLRRTRRERAAAASAATIQCRMMPGDTAANVQTPAHRPARRPAHPRRRGRAAHREPGIAADPANHEQGRSGRPFDVARRAARSDHGDRLQRRSPNAQCRHAELRRERRMDGRRRESSSRPRRAGRRARVRRERRVHLPADQGDEPHALAEFIHEEELFRPSAPDLEGDFPGRRESVHGGCGKNIALRSPCSAQARGGHPGHPRDACVAPCFPRPGKSPSEIRLLVTGIVLHE